MVAISEKMQTADWKKEKHVPVIEAPDTVAADELFDVKVSLGYELVHPNTTEHHIRWITLYFHPNEAKFPYEVARVDFTAHGESAEGPNQGPVYTHHAVTTVLKTAVSGTLEAVAYCNIHGLWHSTKEIAVR